MLFITPSPMKSLMEASLEFRTPGNIQSTPGVQSIVHFKLVLQVFHIVGKTQAVAAGYRFQSTSKWIGIDVFTNSTPGASKGIAPVS